MSKGNEPPASERRRQIEEDIKKFLLSGNAIQHIEDGVSAQDPQGKGKPLRPTRSEKEAAIAEAAKKPQPDKPA